MSELFPPNLDEQIAEVEREIQMRFQVYPRWVANGKLKQDLANRRIEAMRAVLETLRAAKGTKSDG